MKDPPSFVTPKPSWSHQTIAIAQADSQSTNIPRSNITVVECESSEK